MQKKASMIIACYNKGPYLENMLESVKNQAWNNIEVILVNDGSTDNTEEIIKIWEQKLIKRGYQVKIINQENLGVAGAIKTGLNHVSGYYICFVDADDELDKRYVSAMANALEEDIDLDFAICNYFLKNDPSAVTAVTNFCVAEFSKDKLLERLLLMRLDVVVVRYLFKKQYLEKIGLFKNFATEPRGTQEPQILIPVFFGKGKFVQIEEALYTINTYARNLSKYFTEDPVDKLMSVYHQLQLKTIETLEAPISKKIELASLARLGNIIFVSGYSKDILNCKILKRSITNKILGDKPKKINPKSRIFAFGSLGKSASKMLPYIHGTPLWPNYFWDMAAKEDSTVYESYKVTAPNLDMIQKDDIILFFPLLKVPDEVVDIANSRGANIMTIADIEDWVAEEYKERLM